MTASPIQLILLYAALVNVCATCETDTPTVIINFAHILSHTAHVRCTFTAQATHITNSVLQW